VEAYETPGFTQFLGSDGGVLRWVAPAFPPGPFVDPFVFLLRQAPQSDFNVSVRWEGDRPGQEKFSSNPKPVVATAVAGEIVLGPEGTYELVPSEDDPDVMVPYANPGGVAVGDTGVLIAIPPNAVPAGTVVRVRKLAPDQDPPAAAGDLWWCAVVEVTGLPPGVEAALYVPPRRPLPPNSEVALFAPRDGGWERLERNGQASFSGQYIWMPTRGGILAAGTPSGVRNQAVTTTAGGVAAAALPSTGGVQPPRTLPFPPTGLVGALPTPTPVGTIFSLQTSTGQTAAGGSTGSSTGTAGGGTAGSPPGGGDADPFRFTGLKMRRMLDVGNCNVNNFEEPCANAGGGFTSCGSQTCRGTIFQRGLFRNDGTNTCTFTPGGGNPSCSFEPT
jgi:hypothetical protein